jgi:hypothetical protein
MFVSPANLTESMPQPVAVPTGTLKSVEPMETVVIATARQELVTYVVTNVLPVKEAPPPATPVTETDS